MRSRWMVIMGTYWLNNNLRWLTHSYTSSLACTRSRSCTHNRALCSRSQAFVCSQIMCMRLN
jgi:hypothetical protein